MVEQQNLALRCPCGKTAKRLEVGNHNDFRRESFRWSGDAPAQRGQHNLLRSSSGLPGPRNQFAGLNAAHPVRNHRLFKRDLGAQRAHLRSHPLHSLLGLRRSGNPRSDVVRKVPQFGQRVRIAHGRVANLLHACELVGSPCAGAAVDPRVQAIKIALLA